MRHDFLLSSSSKQAAARYSSTHHHHPNNKVDSLAALLQSCSALSAVRRAHAAVLRAGLHRNTSLAATLLSLYASLSPSSPHPLRVFSSVPSPSLSLFNRAIRAFSCGPHSASIAVNLYAEMLRRGFSPDNFTFPFLFNACAAAGDVGVGVSAHGRAAKGGFLGFVQVGNALVDMYGKCGLLNYAHQMFDEMLVRDVVTFNALLGAHAKRGGDMGIARKVFDGMPERNIISWNAMLVGYVNGADLRSARNVFDSMPEKNVVSWTTMLVGYAKNSMVDEARELFDSMPERNLISFTAMIASYSQNGRPREALSLFCAMDGSGLKADAVSMTAAVSAVAQIGSTELADWADSYVVSRGIPLNQHLLTALADMHAKCGSIERARRCFSLIRSPDCFAFSTLINGLAGNGLAVEALQMFDEMLAEGVRPDAVTFVGVLNACSHAGLVDEGLKFWEGMAGHHGVEPGAEHFACLVDMLGRAGRLQEALRLARSMGSEPCAGALGALLAACRSYNEVGIAEAVTKELFELEPENSGNYMLLWSVYAGRERWEDAARVRVKMNKKGFKKLPGFCWT